MYGMAGEVQKVLGRAPGMCTFVGRATWTKHRVCDFEMEKWYP